MNLRLPIADCGVGIADWPTGKQALQTGGGAPVPHTPALSRGERVMIGAISGPKVEAVLREKIDWLGTWAVSALRQADKYALKDWGAPIEATLRANARCYNEAAGLLGEELGICELWTSRN